MNNTAHEYAQKLPLNEHKLVCAACGYTRKITDKEAKRCKPHHVFANSGWKDNG